MEPDVLWSRKWLHIRWPQRWTLGFYWVILEADATRLVEAMRRLQINIKVPPVK